MIVVMRQGAAQARIDAVLSLIEREGQPVHVFKGEERVVIALLGEEPGESLREALESLPGVEEVGHTTRPYKLASREVHPSSTVVKLGELTLGGGLVLGAGSARPSSGERLVELAAQAAAAGADLFWLGRPRQLDLAQILPRLAELRRATGLPLLVEVWGADEIDPLLTYAHGLIVGPEHLQSHPLIRAVGRAGAPVVLCRGLATTIEEWLLIAERVLEAGNFQVALCEQGIRTFETTVRSTLDFGAVAIVKRVSHLPVIANPSLASGRREVVGSMALGTVGAGADGVLIDVHLGPADEAAAGPQSLALSEFAGLATRLRALGAALPAR